MYNLCENPNKKIELFMKEAHDDFYRLTFGLYIDQGAHFYFRNQLETSIETGVRNDDYTINVMFYENGSYKYNLKDKGKEKYIYPYVVFFSVEIYKSYLTSINNLENLVCNSVSLIRKYIEEGFYKYNNFIVELNKKEKDKENVENMLERIAKKYL